jgi:hypothetical protein
VVGGLVGLAIVAGAVFWWRRRRHNNATTGEKHDGVQYDIAPRYSPGLSPHGAPQQTGYYDAHIGVNEADPGATRSEMPATTKYAHRTGEGEVHEAP